MKTVSLALLTLAFSLFLNVAPPARAEMTLSASDKKQLIEKLKKDYPLTVCPVTGEKLGGDMGKPIDYLYIESGKEPRLVRFCCPMCSSKFDKEPAKYLKKIDEAAKAKSAAGL